MADGNDLRMSDIQLHVILELATILPMSNVHNKPINRSYPLEIIWSLVMLVIAAGLRFSWLARQGFVEFDEGWLVESASYMAMHLGGESRALYEDFKASPATSLISAIPIAVFGDTPEAIMYPQAVAGVLGVLLVSYVALRMYGTFVALSALTLGAVSPLQTLFSRSVVLDNYGFLFLSCSYACVLLSKPQQALSKGSMLRIVGSGVFLALALASNYRVLACVVLPSLVLLSHMGLQRRGLVAVIVHTAGFLATLFAIDLAMRIAYPVSRGYFHLLSEQYRHIGSKTFGSTSTMLPSLHIQDGLNIIHGLWDLDNRLTLAAAALWLLLLPLLLWKGRYRRSDIQLFLMLVVPFIMFSLLSVTAIRGLTVAQPFFALAAARIVSAIVVKFSLGRTVLSGAITAALLIPATTFGLYRTLKPDVIGRSNPFDIAFQETCSKYKTGVITILDSGPEFYAKMNKCKLAIVHMGSGPFELLKTYLQGFRFWLIDAQLSAYMPRLFALWPVFENRTPDLLIPAASYVRLDHFLEHTVWSGSTSANEREAYAAWIAKWGTNLPVFDLDNHIKPLTWQVEMKDWYQVGDSYVSLPSRQGALSNYRIAWNQAHIGVGASARFNLHHNILPAQVGVGMCIPDSSNDRCTGFGVIAEMKPRDSRFITLDLKGSQVQHVADVVVSEWLPGPLWIRCVDNRRSVGVGSKTVFQDQAYVDCPGGHPALIAKESSHLEAFELTALAK